MATPNPDDDFSGSGDVKYHLGMSYTRQTVSGKRDLGLTLTLTLALTITLTLALTLAGKPVQISLVANPSHLEAVNPVVEGKARCSEIERDGASGAR